MLPSFLIIGSQKAGTTSLYNILKQHPEIYMPEKKEVNFFFHEKEYRKGIGYYGRFFDGITPEERAYGEASPGYICHPLSPSLIYQYLPNIKLILTVRNPIARAYSQYWDNRMTLSEPLDFNQTLDIALTDTYKPGKLGYFSRGAYFKYIQRYLKFFDPDQLLVLPFEDLLRAPITFYQSCFKFLDVDPDFRSLDMDRAFNPSSVWDNFLYNWFFNHPEYSRYLPAKLKRLVFWGKRKRFQYPSMDQATRERLVKFYEPWNQKLGDYMGRDLSHWNN